VHEVSGRHEPDFRHESVLPGAVEDSTGAPQQDLSRAEGKPRHAEPNAQFQALMHREPLFVSPSAELIASACVLTVRPDCPMWARFGGIIDLEHDL